MLEAPVTRRRSPGWVRQMGDGGLHGLALRLRALRLDDDISERQEWLWDAVVSELEYRWRRHHDDPLRRCWCDLCQPRMF